MLYIDVKMRSGPAAIVEIAPGAKDAPPVCLPNCAVTGSFVNGNE